MTVVVNGYSLHVLSVCANRNNKFIFLLSDLSPIHIAETEQNWLSLITIQRWRQLPIITELSEHLDSNGKLIVVNV